MATWNSAFEATPAGSDVPSAGDDKIRELKGAIRERLDKEHVMDLTSGLLAEDGWHESGSAKAYIQASAPTTRPDGTTALSSADNGRIWIGTSSNTVYVYDHSAGATTAARWVARGVISGDSFKGYESCTLTNYSNSSEPAIASGSVLEVNGVFHELASGLSITGTAASGLNYIRFTATGDTLYSEYTQSASSWSDSLQGWYSGTSRYIGGCDYDGTNYSNKWLYKITEKGRIERNLIIKQDFTLPSATTGDIVELTSIGVNDILQIDAENIINYQNFYTTSKGTSGKLTIGDKESVKLTYAGVGHYQGDLTKISNPGTLPSGNGHWGIGWSHDGVYIAVGSTASPYLLIYKRSGNTLTKLSNPLTLPTGNVYFCEFSHDDTYLAVGEYNSPYLLIYKRSGDTFTKLPNPSNLPPGRVYSGSWTHDDTYLAITFSNGSDPRFYVYKRSGDTFTKLTDPATFVTLGYDIVWSPDGLRLLHHTNGGVGVYSRSGDTISYDETLAIIQASSEGGVDWDPTGVYIAFCRASGESGPGIRRVVGDSWSSTIVLSNPPGTSTSVRFSDDGRFVAAAGKASPYMVVWIREGDSFTKLSNPSNLPTGYGWGIAFSPNSEYVAVTHNASPYVTVYTLALSANKEWILSKLETLETTTTIEERFH